MNEINKQLVKDYKFPIPVTEEPYFSHFAELMEGFYDVTEARSKLLAMCEREGSFESVLGKTRKLIATVVDHIKGKPEYKAFQGMDMESFRGTRLPEKQALYHRDNAQRILIALDMKKANFQAMRAADPQLVDECTSWESFLGQFTDEPYYLDCKQIRQVIFGQLNPKRQQTIMKSRMGDVFNELMNLGVDERQVFSSSPDEIVIGFTPDNLDRVSTLINSNRGFEGLHLDIFTLELAHPSKPFFIKNHTNRAKVDLKGIPKFYVPEVIRHLKGEPANHKDRFFMHEGRLCQYSEPLYNNDTETYQ